MKTNVKLATGMIVASVAAAVLFNNCSGFTAANLSSSNAASGGGGGSYNPVVPITMSSNSGVNIPTVTVTVCVPGTSDCQQISNILIDTGSTGLRIFSSSITIPLPNFTTGGTQIGECYQFGSAMAFWGSVQTADVILGGERANSINIQSINPTWTSTVPSDCTSEDGTTFVLATDSNGDEWPGWNGILGVQQFPLDCSIDNEPCTPGSTAAIYYTCPSGNCSDYSMPAGSQVPNPVAKMPLDNNGFSITVGSISTSGATSASAYMMMGIGTQSFNGPAAGVTPILTDDDADFTTTFEGQSYQYGFIDTGSWDFSFEVPSGGTAIATCTTEDMTMYCPTNPVSLSATISSTSGGSGSVPISFSVMNGSTAFTEWADNGNFIFNDIGDPGAGLSGFNSFLSQVFDWGLPVFFGRTIYFGMSGSSTPLGTGPYDAL